MWYSLAWCVLDNLEQQTQESPGHKSEECQDGEDYTRMIRKKRPGVSPQNMRLNSQQQKSEAPGTII